MLLAIFLLGAIGTGAELLLLGHYEEIWQLIPLGLLTIGLTVLAAWFIAGGRGLFRVFRVAMICCLAAGGLGIYLHYQSNVEFELEMNPSVGGTELVWNSLTGAMPALAPGTMFQLGLIGLLYTYRHPVFRTETEPVTSPEGDNHDT
jgi:hypothetical protein